MKFFVVQIVMLLLFNSINLFGQNKIILVHKNETDKQAIVLFDRKFEIISKENSYHTSIINAKDGNITIIEHNLKKDTSNQINSPTKTPYNWVYDTLKIPFEQIEYIKAYRFKNRNWTMPFVFIAAVIIGSVFLNPLVSATQGKDTAGKMTIMQISLMTITLPPILIGTRKVKYDLKNKWKVKAIE